MISRLNSGYIERSWILERCHVVWGKAVFFPKPLSIQMYKWEPLIIILGRRAIINLSSSRYETLGLVTTYHITFYKHTGRPEDWCFIMEIGVNQPFYSWSAKKVQVRRASRKLKYCISQVIKAVVFEGKSTPPLSSLWYAVHWFSLAATMDLCWLRKQ